MAGGSRFELATAATIERAAASLLVSRERLSVDETVQRTAEEPTPADVTTHPDRASSTASVCSGPAGTRFPDFELPTKAESPFDTLHEECGVFGICAPGEDVVNDTYMALFALQHRGQESCGIAVNRDGVISLASGPGLVGDVLTEPMRERLGTGSMAVGHCRYATTGHRQEGNTQPLLVNHLKGSMALAHNGNLVNARALREEYERQGCIFHGTSDSEVLAYAITMARLNTSTIEEAVQTAMGLVDGAISSVIMSPRKLVGVRDRHGFRPLCLGKLGAGWVLASESCALDSIGATFVRDIEPGEIIVLTPGAEPTSLHYGEKTKRSLCVFELIYFARPDSVIDGTSVQAARLRAGALLAIDHPVAADVVVGVPDSGIDAALGFARQSGIPYSVGFIKNKYIGRTFIEPGQGHRESAVRIKLNPVAEAIRGKRVVLVDDSIVRGTTITRIVGLLRDMGATEVHVRLAAPPFRYPCYYGTDISSSDHLIAYQHSVDEICQMIGADSVGYLDVADLPKLDATGRGHFCDACFTGQYATETPPPDAPFAFEKWLGDPVG